MKKFICIILPFLTHFVGCEKKETPVEPTSVSVFRVSEERLPADFTFVGVAKSSHPVEIRSRVEGYLNSIDYVEGSVVKPNQPLFVIDPRPFEAKLEQAKGELARQEAVLWRAERSLKRLEPLYEQNAASQRDRDDALAQVLAGEAEVISAKAKVEEAQLNLNYCYLTSPILGLSGRASSREGTLITPAVNGLLTVISVIDPIWVVFSISDIELLMGRAEGKEHEIILPKNQNDYSVTLELADGSIFPYTGSVNFTSPTLDEKTGTMTVRADFDNPEGEVLPGQFVRATVSGAYRPNALVVPQAAVFQGRSGMYVFVVDEGNVAQIRPVTVGEWYRDYWIINHGLSPGELVVAEGVNRVEEGSKVSYGDIEVFHQ